MTHDLELAAIIHALKMRRHYIHGTRFIFMRDHNGLRYLFEKPILNVREARWSATISEFEFEISYMKGKENRVADAFSKRIHVNHIETMSSYGTYL